MPFGCKFKILINSNIVVSYINIVTKLSLLICPIPLIKYFKSYDNTKQLISSFISFKIFCFLSNFIIP